MPRKPDVIINKTAKFFRDALLTIAFFVGIVGFFGESEANGGMVFLAVVIAVGAACIKTKYKHRGGVDFYK